MLFRDMSDQLGTGALELAVESMEDFAVANGVRALPERIALVATARGGVDDGKRVVIVERFAGQIDLSHRASSRRLRV